GRDPDAAGRDHADAGDRGDPPAGHHAPAISGCGASGQGSASVSTWPRAGSGASGHRWKTATARAVPSLTTRWRALIGTSRPSPAATGAGAPSTTTVTVPSVT